MFINAFNKPTSECIGHAVLQTKSASAITAGYVVIPDAAAGSKSILVQVYIDPNDLPRGKTMDDYRDKPLVTINEFDDTISDTGYATPGMKLLNWGNFLLETPSNIGNAKIVPFDADLNVYVALSYYK